MIPGWRRGAVSNQGQRRLRQLPAEGHVRRLRLRPGRQLTDVTEVLSGNAVYFDAPGLMGASRAGKTWVKIDLSDARAWPGLDLSLLTQNPTQFSASSRPRRGEELGTETIDGAETTHLQVDEGRPLGDPASGETHRIEERELGPIDVWIGKHDGYVHRESVTISASRARYDGRDVRAAAQSISRSSMSRDRGRPAGERDRRRVEPSWGAGG